MNNEKSNASTQKYTKSYAKHTKKKGIFEQIEEAFNEMASEFDEEEQTKKHHHQNHLLKRNGSQ